MLSASYFQEIHTHTNKADSGYTHVQWTVLSICMFEISHNKIMGEKDY